MRVGQFKCFDLRKQHLTDVVRALNLRVAEIKRSSPVPGTQQPRLPSSPSQQRAKCTLTSYFDTIPRGESRGCRLKDSMLGPPRSYCSFWAASTGVLVLSYTESVQQPVRVPTATRTGA